jgi:hypothetical protein
MAGAGDVYIAMDVGAVPQAGTPALKNSRAQIDEERAGDRCGNTQN